MNFTAAKTQQFNVAIALNIESNGIEIGQRFSILVFFPIISVSPEKDGGAGRVLRDIKGPENGHLLFGGMSGENRDLIEEAFETSHRSREGDNDGVRGRCLDDNLAFARAERVARGRVHLRIHQSFHRVSDVFGSEWCAIGKMQTSAEMKFDSAAVRTDFPRSGQAGLESLRLPIQADQDAAREVADRFRGRLFD